MYYNYSINEEQFLKIGKMLEEASNSIKKDAPWHRNYKELKWEDKLSHFEIFGNLNLDTKEVETILCAILALKNVLILPQKDSYDYGIYLDEVGAFGLKQIGQCSRISVLKVVAEYC